MGAGPVQAAEHPGELGGVFLQGGHDAALTLLGSAEEEMQPHDRLAGTGGTGEYRGGPGPQPAAQHVVQPGDPGADPRVADRVAAGHRDVGQPGEQAQPGAGEPVTMLAGIELAAAQLPHVQEAQFPLAELGGGQLHDRVGHRELGGYGCLAGLVFADPQRGDGEGGQPAGKLVQELPEFRVPAGEGVQGLEAVDDDQPGPTVSHDGGDPLAHAGQPVPAGDLAQILVENRLADRGGLEELQGLPEADDLLQRLGQGGEVDGGAVRGGVVERVMLGEDRLAGARQPHDHRDAVVRQAAAEDLVQGPVAAAEPAVVHQRSCPASMALDRSRSRTVDTSWSGSSGLRRNASAPASIAASMTSTADTATIATSACARKWRHSSTPAPPEISTSTTTTAGRAAVNASRATQSVGVTSTSNPSVLRKNSWSSAAKTSGSASWISSR